MGSPCHANGATPLSDDTNKLRFPLVVTMFERPLSAQNKTLIRLPALPPFPAHLPHATSPRPVYWKRVGSRAASCASRFKWAPSLDFPPACQPPSPLGKTPPDRFPAFGIRRQQQPALGHRRPIGFAGEERTIAAGFVVDQDAGGVVPGFELGVQGKAHRARRHRPVFIGRAAPCGRAGKALHALGPFRFRLSSRPKLCDDRSTPDTTDQGAASV